MRLVVDVGTLVAETLRKRGRELLAHPELDLVVAALECGIWTADQDFFGCGVAVWTTETLRLHLIQPA